MNEAVSVRKNFGAIVFVHNRSSLPETSESLNLQPGTFVDISIKKEVRSNVD